MARTSDFCPDGRVHSLIKFKLVDVPGDFVRCYQVFFRSKVIGIMIGSVGYWTLIPFDSGEPLTVRTTTSRIELVEQYLSI